MRPLLAQTAAELRLALRQGEQLLVSLGIPLLVLVFFSLVDVLPLETDEPVDVLAPGVLSLAVMSTAMVSLGISTGFERHYAVLKRLGTTPLGRPRLLAAKASLVACVELLQIMVLVPVALLLGWSPESGVGVAVPALLVGTAAFAGIGLLLAGTLPGPLNLAVCNALYLVMLLLGGMIVPLEELPGALRGVAELLPAAALTTLLLDAFSGAEVDLGAFAVLVGWAIVAPAAAALTFRWE